MKDYLSQVGNATKNGDLTVRDFNRGAAAGVIIPTNLFINGVSEEERNVVLEEVLQKMAGGKTLSPEETDIIYDYFQNELLDDEKRKEVEEIAGYIDEENIDKLTDRLNEKVVISDRRLEEEMEMVQAYVFIGNKLPSETNVHDSDRTKLEAYLMLLKDYHTQMVVEDKVIKVFDMEYEVFNIENEEGHKDIFGHN
ncbi:hypothetical protein J11TS1_21290 [Oceanobacillus sp. J11TS1]|nr:hypothetical protein J11TS1_21290 [Oceanobacillus sp. J11TS1]